MIMLRWYKSKTSLYNLIAMLVLILTGLPLTGHADQKPIREPVWSGRFYPAQKAELQKVIQDFTHLAEKTPMTLPEGKDLKALIIPHAGIFQGCSEITINHSHGWKIIDPRKARRFVAF